MWGHLTTGLRSLAVACVLWPLAGHAQAPATTSADLLTITNDALQYSAAYRAARAQYVAARELEPQAAGKLWPQLTAYGKYDFFFEDISGQYFGFDIDRSDDFHQSLFGARLTQALYRPELLLEKQQATRKLEQAGHALRAQQDALLLDAAEAYFGVLAAEEAERFSQAELDTLAQQLAQSQARLDAGLTIEVELKSVEARYQMARAEATRTQDAVLDARTTLEALTGRSYGALHVLPEQVALTPPQPADVAAWLTRAQRENPQIRIQQMALEVAQMQRAIADRAQLPKVDLVGNAYWMDSSGGATGERDETQQSIGVIATLPLFAGGQIQATRRQTLALQDQAQALLQDATRRVERDVRIAHRRATSGLQQVRALQRAVDAAISAEDAARAAFDAGTITTAERLDAVEKRYATERDYASARHAFLLISLQLKVLAGNLLVADLAQVNQLLAAPAPR